MGGDSRREYLRAIRQRYSEASREEKGPILRSLRIPSSLRIGVQEDGISDREFCAVCSYHRKHAIRLLNQRKREPRKRPGRKPVYHSTELLRALKRIWLVMKARWFNNYVCRNVDQLIDRLDQAILDVINNPEHTQKTAAIGTLF